MAPPLGAEIVWLGAEACAATGVVGGKAANLSRLAGLHDVPPGFCLTARAFASERPSLPVDLRAELAAAYRELGTRAGVAAPRVAVRSSAVDEDGADASFAGQHETYLNVVGEDAVAEAVVRCWESAASPRALEYRRQRGMACTPAVAVLVQQMVPADVSAVAFSANPITGARDEVVINASWGLGESIVGGTVTPDCYVVKDDAVISRAIADKLRMTVADEQGTREVDVPRFLRARPALEDGQAIETARLARALERALGWPVDVECAYAGARLHLLQCRPITTLGGESR